MSVKLGLNANLYYNSGSHGSPTWNAITKVKDNNLTSEINLSDVSSRASGGFREYAATLADAGIEFGLVCDGATAHVTVRDVLRAAHFARTPIELLALDGPIATDGSEGLRATFIISQFNRNEGLEEGIVYAVTAKPTPSDNAPEWVKATSGAVATA